MDASAKGLRNDFPGGILGHFVSSLLVRGSEMTRDVHIRDYLNAVERNLAICNNSYVKITAIPMRCFVEHNTKTFAVTTTWAEKPRRCFLGET